MNCKISLLLLTLTGAAYAADIITDVDSQDTSATTLSLYEQDEGTLRVNFYTDDVAVSPSGIVTFWYATNGLFSSAISSFTATVAGSNYLDMAYTTNAFPQPTPGTRPWVYGITVGNKTYGDGKLYIKNDPSKASSALTLIATYNIDYSDVTNYLNVASSGPVRPDGISITNVVNADGSITIYANIASYTESDPIYAASSNLWLRIATAGTQYQPTGTYATVAALGVVSAEVAVASSDVDTLQGMTNSYLTAETDTLNSVVQRGHTVTNAGDFILLGDQPDNGFRDAALRVLVGSHYGILATTTGDYAIYGIASGDMGVYGKASDDYGVRGYATDDRGVYGESGDDYGVYGYANGSFGVYGKSPAGGYGGYFTAARTGLYVTVTGPGPVAYFDGAIALSGGVSIAKSDIDNWNEVAAPPGFTNAAGRTLSLGGNPTADRVPVIKISGSVTNVTWTDPVWMQKDGGTAASGNFNMGGNAVTNIDTLRANQIVVQGLYDPTADTTLIVDVDLRRLTNIVNVAFADGTVQTTADTPETDPVWLAASGSVVRVGSDLYYEGGSLKFFESDVALSVLNNSVGHMFIDLQNGSEKIMYEASATNMDIALGMIYGKNSGKKFLDIAAHNIYGAGGQLNIELDVAYEIRDTAGHDTLRFTDASQALMYDGGTVKAFDLASSKQINNHVGTKILQLDSDVGLFGENANLILGMSAIHGYRVNDKGGTNFIDLALRRLTNVVNIGFADGTVQTSASAGGGGGGAGASYSEDFAPGDFDAVTNLTITHNLGEKVIAQIYDANSNQFFTGLQLQDDNAVFDMHLFHSTTGFVVVAAGTNTVNFSEFLTSGNVSTNDMDATADAAYRSGSESIVAEAYQAVNQDNLTDSTLYTIDLDTLVHDDEGNMVDLPLNRIWLRKVGMWGSYAHVRFTHVDDEVEMGLNVYHVTAGAVTTQIGNGYQNGSGHSQYYRFGNFSNFVRTTTTNEYVYAMIYFVGSDGAADLTGGSHQTYLSVWYMGE